MKNILFYLKFMLIAAINTMIIIIFSGIIFSAFGIEPIKFIATTVKDYNIPYFFLKPLFYLYSSLTMTLAIIPILFTSYIILLLDLQKKWKILAIITSLVMILITFLCPYFLGYVCYSFLDLALLIILNIYIIFILSKRQILIKYRPHAIIFLISIYIYLVFILKI